MSRGAGFGVVKEIAAAVLDVEVMHRRAMKRSVVMNLCTGMWYSAVSAAPFSVSGPPLRP
jgi:hypothetical protein